MKWPELQQQLLSDDPSTDKSSDLDVKSHFISFFSADGISAVIWWNWTAITKHIKLFWAAANRNPTRPPPSLSAVLNSLAPSRQDDRNNLAKWDWQFISEINIYNLLLSKFILGEGSILSTSQISWSYLRRPWNEFPPQNVSVFFLLLPLTPSQKSMSAFVRFNLASDDSKSLSVSGRAAVSGWHHFPSEQRARPVWTLGDTWGSNVAGHVSAGPLIREGDSQTCCGCRQPGEPHLFIGQAQKTEESTAAG